MDLEGAEDLLLMAEAVTGASNLAADVATADGRVRHEARTVVANTARCALSRPLPGPSNTLGLPLAPVAFVPRIVRLIARHCALFGDRLLTGADDAEGASLEEPFVEAVRWLESHIDSSEIGLLEFGPVDNPDYTAFVHTGSEVSYDGELANPDGPIAPLDLQGVAYDALIGAAELLATRCPEVAEVCRERAQALQIAVLRQMWMKDERYFASIDRNTVDGRTPRQIRTITSRAAVLLETRLLLDLPSPRRRLYVEPIVRRIHQERTMLTPVGIRSRSIEHGSIVPYADEHGDRVCSLRTTSAYAVGLRRHGFHRCADDIENRTQAAESAAHWYVTTRCQVVPDVTNCAITDSESHDSAIPGTVLPGRGAGGDETVGMRSRLCQARALPMGPVEHWVERLDEQFMAIHRRVAVARWLREMDPETTPPPRVDVEAGAHARREWVAAHRTRLAEGIGGHPRLEPPRQSPVAGGHQGR